jgi:hypothetical protein
MVGRGRGNRGMEWMKPGGSGCHLRGALCATSNTKPLRQIPKKEILEMCTSSPHGMGRHGAPAQEPPRKGAAQNPSSRDSCSAATEREGRMQVGKSQMAPVNSRIEDGGNRGKERQRTPRSRTYSTRASAPACSRGLCGPAEEGRYAVYFPSEGVERLTTPPQL